MPVRRANHKPDIHQIIGDTELINCDINSMMFKNGKSFEHKTGGEQSCSDDDEGRYLRYRCEPRYFTYRID
jgi:hypothetical protein